MVLMMAYIKSRLKCVRTGINAVCFHACTKSCEKKTISEIYIHVWLYLDAQTHPLSHIHRHRESKRKRLKHWHFSNQNINERKLSDERY